MKQLQDALESVFAHWAETGHSSRIVWSVQIENRSKSVKYLTQGGRGVFQAECRQCKAVV